MRTLAPSFRALGRPAAKPESQEPLTRRGTLVPPPASIAGGGLLFLLARDHFEVTCAAW